MACASIQNSSCHLNERDFSKPNPPSSTLPQQNKTSSTQLCHLKFQQKLLEKKQEILIGTLKNLEPHLSKELSDLEEELNRKRLQDNKTINRDVVAIVHLLKDLKNAVTQNVKEIDIEHFKGNLIELEGKIAACRDIFEKQSFQLHKEQQNLHVHIASVAMKIDEWAKPIQIDSVLPSNRHKGLCTSGNCYNERVNNFQKFLRDRGGHTGGWDEADHLTFIRLRSKYQNKQALYTHLHQQFPDKTLQALREHDQWYAEYEDLKAKQKQAVAEWRARKSKSVRRTVNSSENLPGQMMSKSLQKIDLCDYREQQKQRLEKWRNMKEQELQMKALKKEQEQEKQLIEEEARKNRHAAQKAELERYKEEKLKNELVEALEKEALQNIQAEERAWNANKILKTFRQRDAKILARHKEMKDRVEQERNAKEKVLEVLRQKVRVEVARDPHRLLRSTGAWRERIKIEKNMASVSCRSTVSCNVQEVSHLGVPLWRKSQK